MRHHQQLLHSSPSSHLSSTSSIIPYKKPHPPPPHKYYYQSPPETSDHLTSFIPSSHTPYSSQSHSSHQQYGCCRPRKKGPTKVLCFCLLAIILPSALLSIALLMRFVFTGHAHYALSPSDMRLIDYKLSTTWCQSAVLKSNGTFTTYVTSAEPQLIEEDEPLTMHRTFIVPDDHKEYWGFYLLKGSSFKIHTCSRHKGGTLLVILGRSHLEHCAYIGEADSAGDSDMFSSSSSTELQHEPHPHSKNSSISKEEMSLILSKIRHYIRSGPNNYGKLKHNLLQWNLISDNETTTETTPPLDHGMIYPGTGHKSRRSINRLSESGENTANEVIDPVPHSTPKNHTHPQQTPSLIWTSDHAHHTGVLNKTTSQEQTDGDDGSDSESESSWSSSEEAMARCEGVITHVPIPYNDSCTSDATTPPEFYFQANVNQSGYYYFIFASENEKRDNIIRAHFELNKHVYHLPEPMEGCRGVKECNVNFTFAGGEKLIVTLPRPPPERDSAWDDVYILESDCRPRTAIYLVFVFAVPLLILLCAFQ